MATRGNSAQGTALPGHFDFDAFKVYANSAPVLQNIKVEVVEKYQKLINKLENSIKKKQRLIFEVTLTELERLVKYENIRKLEILKDLREKWTRGKWRGGDVFKFIHVEKKVSPTSNSGKHLEVQRLREIAKILDDDNQETGTKRKKPTSVDEILTQIEGACHELVQLRQKLAVEEINKNASLKLIMNWTLEFEKCIENKTFREDEINPSTTNAIDKDVITILEQLNRTMNLLHTQKREEDSLAKCLRKKATQILSSLKPNGPAVYDKRTPSGSEDQNLESMDMVKVMDKCVGELYVRIYDLSIQANRLTQSSEMLTNFNTKLVAQIEPNKPNKTNQTTNNEQNEILQDLETVTKNIKTKLGDLETNCKRYEEVVKEVDKEIEELDKDLEEWDKHQNIDIKTNYDKCSCVTLRNLRMKLQKCKKESNENKNQDKGKKIVKKVEQLCGNNGVKTEKKDDYVQMLEDLDKQLIEEKKSLNALEKETCDLLKQFDDQNEIPDKTSDMSTVDKISLLIKSFANANVVKFKEDCRKDTETFDDLKSTFQQVLVDIYELAGRKAPTEVTDPIAMRNNAKQQLQDLKAKQKEMKFESQREINDWKLRAENEKWEKKDLKARLLRDVDAWKERAEKERREKEDYMTRFSKIASAQLKDNNPNIADLSDQNRPTKLADEYSEIYDNEWTDAYTYLEKKIKTEPERIDKLLQILLNVYGVCCKIRDQQLNGMKTAILRPAKFYHSQNQVQQVAERPESVEKPNAQQGGKGKSPVPAKSKEKKLNGDKDDDMKLDPVHSKTLTDIGKETSATTIDDVLEYFKTQQKQLFEAEPMDRYSTKLIRLCWLMRLHSPPVCIGSIEEKGSKFDKTKYRAYTKSGKKIEFVVWPTLLFHENGGMLKQGTAQGF